MVKLSEQSREYAATALYVKCPECGDTGTGWPGGMCKTCDGGKKKQRLAQELGYRWVASENQSSSYAGGWEPIDD